MITATKPQKKKPAAGKSTPETTAAIAVTKEQRDWIEHLHEDGSKPIAIELDQLVPSPTNPRKSFDEAKLAELAQSILIDGILQPIVCRPMESAYAKQRYEIVCGERRYRAAKKLNLASAPCSVRELSDQDVIRIQQIENLQREDLNAIEEAEGFRKSCMPVADGGGGYSQTELAKVLGCDQSHISNRMRLLTLPETIKAKVISQEIPATHAREMLPYVGNERVAIKLGEAWQSLRKHHPEPSVKEWTRRIEETVVKSTAAIKREGFCQHGHGFVEVQLSADDIAKHPELEVIDIKRWSGKERRAMNAPLAKKLLKEKWDAAVKRLAEKNGKPVLEGKAADKAKDREAAKQAKQQFAEKLDRWKAEWASYLIAGKLLEHNDADFDTLINACTTKLILCQAAEGNCMFSEFKDVMDQRRLKPSKGTRSNVGAWDYLSMIPDAEMMAVAREVMARSFCDLADPEQPKCEDYWPLDDLRLIAADLGIDGASEWRNDKAGPLTASLFALLSDDQLVAIAEDWRMAHVAEACEREELIEKLIASVNPKPMPSVLEVAKPRKKK